MRMLKTSLAPVKVSQTQMTDNATPITIKASVEGRKTAKKLKLPASASFNDFMQQLAAKYKAGVDSVSYVDSDGDASTKPTSEPDWHESKDTIVWATSVAATALPLRADQPRAVDRDGDRAAEEEAGAAEDGDDGEDVADRGGHAAAASASPASPASRAGDPAGPCSPRESCEHKL